ncbi:MAG TPA: SWIM zinc finger family protein [Pirellulales bacterium]|nr:SWIM zinc finger family protein [Pirellulales bacterium]
MYWGGWKPYVPVARRRAQAASFAAKQAKKEKRELRPVNIEGRKIARTFWGEAWCDNLERYSDFENRLPRGRTYVRNGSVIDLHIEPGRVKAFVSGSDVYTVKVEIDRLKPADWKRIKAECSESIDSLLDLLAGRFSDGVMKRLTREKDGLFPHPKEIRMSCSCPDWAGLCKHIAAVLYGVAARLDEEPQLLFLLRDVDHGELVSQAVSGENLKGALGGRGGALAGEDLGAMFGIDLDSSDTGQTAKKGGGRKRRASSLRVEPSAVATAETPAKRSKKKPAAATSRTIAVTKVKTNVAVRKRGGTKEPVPVARASRGKKAI